MASKTPTLTQAEEATLIGRAQRGDTAAQGSLIEAHDTMLAAWARKSANSTGAEFDDLHQEARLAFLEAIQSFDPTRGLRLSTFAGQHAKGAITEALPAASTGQAFTVPGRTMRRYLAAWKAAESDEFEAALEVAVERYGMDPDTFHAVYFSQTSVSLDAPLRGAKGEDIEGTYHQVVPAAHDRPLDEFDDMDEANRLLSVLKEPHLSILRMAMGFLGDVGPLTDLEIASLLGMSRATVQRRRIEALAILQEVSRAAL